MLCSCWIKIIVLKFGSDKGVFFRQNSILHVLDVEKALLHSYQKASFLMGHQTNHRTNGMFYLIKLTLIMSQTLRKLMAKHEVLFRYFEQCIYPSRKIRQELFYFYICFWCSKNPFQWCSKDRPAKTVLLITHNMCFAGEIMYQKYL